MQLRTVLATCSSPKLTSTMLFSGVRSELESVVPDITEKLGARFLDRLLQCVVSLPREGRVAADIIINTTENLNKLEGELGCIDMTGLAIDVSEEAVMHEVLGQRKAFLDKVVAGLLLFVGDSLTTDWHSTCAKFKELIHVVMELDVDGPMFVNPKTREDTVWLASSQRKGLVNMRETIIEMFKQRFFASMIEWNASKTSRAACLALHRFLSELKKNDYKDDGHWSVFETACYTCTATEEQDIIAAGYDGVDPQRMFSWRSAALPLINQSCSGENLTLSAPLDQTGSPVEVSLQAALISNEFFSSVPFARYLPERLQEVDESRSWQGRREHG